MSAALTRLCSGNQDSEPRSEWETGNQGILVPRIRPSNAEILVTRIASTQAEIVMPYFVCLKEADRD